jgi:flagellar motor protein MotB
MADDGQKCPECNEGAPEYMLTYGDMMTLLLCFFSFSSCPSSTLSSSSGIVTPYYLSL